jgi:hypothetical protein
VNEFVVAKHRRVEQDSTQLVEPSVEAWLSRTCPHNSACRRRRLAGRRRRLAGRFGHAPCGLDAQFRPVTGCARTKACQRHDTVVWVQWGSQQRVSDTPHRGCRASQRCRRSTTTAVTRCTLNVPRSTPARASLQACTQARTQARARACNTKLHAHTQACTHTHTHTHASTHASTQARTRARTPTRPPACLQHKTACTHASMHAHTHARTHTRTHTPTRSQARTRPPAPLHCKFRGPFTTSHPLHLQLRRLQPGRNGSIPPRNSRTEHGRSVLGVTKSAPPPPSQPNGPGT